MEKKTIKKLKLSRDTAESRRQDIGTSSWRWEEHCPTLHCTKPEYNCTVTCDAA